MVTDFDPKERFGSPWIDLSTRIDETMTIFTDGDYSDPPFRASPWARLADCGFEVWKLELGTQTGTHIDAPAHFHAGGASLAELDADQCIGRYESVTSEQLSAGAIEKVHQTCSHLFLDVRSRLIVPKAAVESLLPITPVIWVMAGQITVDDHDPYWFNRRLAEAGKYLVEDLDMAGVGELAPSGEIITLPLKLGALSGAPTRVLIRSDAS